MLPAQLEQLKNVQFWATAAHVGVGMGLTGLATNMILGTRFATKLRFMPGIGGALGRAVVSAGTAALVGYAGGKVAEMAPAPMKKAVAGAGRNLLIGGLTYTLVKFLYEAAPAVASKFLPGIEAPTARPRVTAAAAPAAAEPMAGLGYYGLGQESSVTSAENIVEGESAARAMGNVGDFLEMTGMGGSGGVPIPVQDFQNLDGMGALAPMGYPGQYGGPPPGGYPYVEGMGDFAEFKRLPGGMWSPGAGEFKFSG
jgi:hypothetical protein